MFRYSVVDINGDYWIESIWYLLGIKIYKEYISDTTIDDKYIPFKCKRSALIYCNTLKRDDENTLFTSYDYVIVVTQDYYIIYKKRYLFSILISSKEVKRFSNLIDATHLLEIENPI